MLIITLKYLQDFKPFDFADSKLNYKMLVEMTRQILVRVLPSTWYILLEIICLIKIRDGRHTDRQTETGDLFLRTLGVIKDRKNVKVESRPTDSITILPLLDIIHTSNLQSTKLIFPLQTKNNGAHKIWISISLSLLKYKAILRGLYIWDTCGVLKNSMK